MQTFTYTITDPLGIHARPAGLLARVAKNYPDTEVIIAKGDSSAKAVQLMKLMTLGVKQGDQITVSAEGPSESEAIAAVKKFLAENL